MKADFIIVGQGLAGTLLAYELFRQNKTVVVFNDPNQLKSSDVAAGIINPVVFRRMTKSWLVDDAFPQMESTYRELEEILHEQLYYPGQMLKILGEDEFIFWKEKAFANHLENYLEAVPVLNLKDQELLNAFSFGCVNKSGRLDIQKLISTFSGLLAQQNLIRNEKLDYEKLILLADSITYDNIIAQKIIFCEGSAAAFNPFFKNLKFKHSKGEVLELKIRRLKLNEIISDEVFVAPIWNNKYKVGATYTWDKLNVETTDSARKELLDKLQNISSAPFEVLSQKAGIRPTMHDRKPVIGLLPENPQIGIFNGLGSKGVLLGPYFAKQFANYLVGNSNYIHPEANIERYFKRK
ncbi:NAD(P)/FAD-dependent oxidoreductase [Aquipluma nitroreducens]|nr:FAD-binding oxidoreductase [Aquipluma nitroreducens]